MEQRGQKRGAFDRNVASPLRSRGKSTCITNYGVPSKRKVSHLLSNLSLSQPLSEKATKHILINQKDHDLIVGSAGIGAEKRSAHGKKRKAFDPELTASVTIARKIPTKKSCHIFGKSVDANKSPSFSQENGCPSQMLYSRKLSSPKNSRGNSKENTNYSSPSKNKKCKQLPNLYSVQPLKGSAMKHALLHRNDDAMYSIDIEIKEELPSSQNSMSKAITTELSVPETVTQSTYVARNPSGASKNSSLKQVENSTLSNDKEDIVRSPFYPTPSQLALLVSPVKLASLYSGESEEGLPPATTVKSRDCRFATTARASTKPKRYHLSDPSRRSCPEMWRRNSRRSNQFPCTTPRKKRTGLLKFYYTESLDKKICDIECKRNIPFLEFSIISLESKLNQALLDLQAKDQTIDLLSQQLNNKKPTNSDICKDKPCTSDLITSATKRQLNAPLHEAQPFEKDNAMQSEAATDQLSEQAPFFVRLSENDTTTTATCTRITDSILVKEPVSAQTNIDQNDILQDSSMILEQVMALKNQMKELQHDHRMLQEDIRNAVRAFSSGSCVIYNNDRAVQGSLETSILPYIQEQVRSSAEDVIVNLALNNDKRSAEAVKILQRKVERANAKAEQYRVKAEHEKYKFSVAIKKVMLSLQNIKKVIEGGAASRRRSPGRQVEDKDKDMNSKALFPLHNIESWEQFSSRFRLALEGKWPDHNRGSRFGYGRLTLVNPCVQSKAKSLLLELSFERDGTPVKVNHNSTTAQQYVIPCGYMHGELESNMALGCNYEEVFMDAVQQMS